jgi:RimJ/RimL family protein N-acetyltransferase
MKNIEIRKAQLKDADGMAELMREGFKRNNFIYTGGNKYTKKQFGHLKEVLSLKKDQVFFVAIDKDSKKILGSSAYSFKKEGRLRHRIDLGLFIHPDYQGQGIGTELLKGILKYAKEQGFKRAEAELAVKNIASRRILEKNKFKIEGTKKKGMLTDDGKYIDTYIVGRIL